MASNTNTLLHLEDLALPSFQVIVMTANMGCAECRKRVSQVISKITGLREYIVDVSNKQVIIKADSGILWEVKNDFSKTEKRKDWHPLEVFKCLAPVCAGKQISLAD
ncbi:HEAVY METAL ASSOCIATED PROTEIN 19 [Hibiscus trionum]|uniref:HEAVY METAL ASSOCIATED PROTEIN 19 n=1 Tax=Hibiscus trionum TaxID=183268 RepID=A0A9W7MJY3_HIBTR|nr:HEAVY METAL ASSOCIATED PROTEIN 19 [Hibiscus trionum]